MNDDDILQAQRVLRKRLFEGDAAIRWRPGRELAAQLLLYLDDPQTSWRLTAEWLRDLLDADRVDGGYGGFIAPGGMVCDYVAVAEVQRDSLSLPSVLGIRFDAADPAIRSIWNHDTATRIADVTQSHGVTEVMRGALRTLGTASKLALPLSDGTKPIGLICADWHFDEPRWNPTLCDELGGLARDALGPLLAAAAPFSATGAAAKSNAPPTLSAADLVPSTGELAVLTPAELKVARLVATGMSYKEVARRLDRSLSTVDHQLRSIRFKLGARSTARLVHMLNALL